MNKETHPWQSAKDDFDNTTLPYLKKNGKRIGEESQSGNEKAKEIIKYYSMLARSFDPMTLVLLDKSISDYDNSYQSTL